MTLLCTLGGYVRVNYEKGIYCSALERCRTQFALVADMERKWGAMRRIVEEVRG